MQNQALMQYFEWYLPNDGQHWNRLREAAPHLAHLGIRKVWMPPAFKATNTDDVGYGVYDLYDLGEFNQKGDVRTKYGTKEEYLEAIHVLKEHGIDPIADIVLNHKANADEREHFEVIKMDPNHRQNAISHPYEIEGWTKFTFPGRQGMYSDFIWHWYHFSGIDYDAKHGETGIYMIMGENKGWADDATVDSENGNFDYLMFADIDYRHPGVVEHLHEWMQWYVNTTGIRGFRLDAIKHIDQTFMSGLIKHAMELYGEDFYVFGEYWKNDIETKEDYLDGTDYTFDLVDVTLHMNFYQAGQQEASFDLRTLFDGSLMQLNPQFAVTFVDNHDTQRGQSLESTVAEWFKPIAYASILLREQGLPCIFYGDYYGIEGEFGQQSFQEVLDKLLRLRLYHAYGEQIDYLDDPHCIGWTRLGNEEYPQGLAVVLSNHNESFKRMHVGIHNAGKKFTEQLGHRHDEVHIDAEGWGDFPVNAMSVSVWAKA